MPTTNLITLAFCWCFKDTEPQAGLARLRSFGFEGIELWPDYLNAFGASAWAQALEEAGMRCVKLCPYFNFMRGEESLATSRQMLVEYLAAAKALDCSRLRVFTGPPWGEGVVGGAQATSHQWQDAISGLREFCDRAAAQGVELCLECHEGSLMEDAPSALRLLHGVDRENLTVNLQLPLLNEPWTKSLELLGDRTTHIHIHNWTGGLGEGDLTFLDAGKFDWRPVLEDLCVKRQRPLCLSVEHADHHGRDDAWESARRDGAYLNKLRAELAAV
jgi:sugar phosphate isomerase/epimerase